MGTWGPERHLQENARIRDNEASNSIDNEMKPPESFKENASHFELETALKN